MDRQGKDPDTMSAEQIMTFCEQLEEAEDFTPAVKKEAGKGKSKGKGQKPSSNDKGDGKYYCLLHGKNDSHDSNDCHKLKDQAKRLKTGNSQTGSSKNKTWKRDSDKSTNKSKKELNAMTKKMEKLQKEVNSIKKRKSDDDDESVHNIEREMFDCDISDDISV